MKHCHLFRNASLLSPGGHLIKHGISHAFQVRRTPYVPFTVVVRTRYHYVSFVVPRLYFLMLRTLFELQNIVCSGNPQERHLDLSVKGGEM